MWCKDKLICAVVVIVFLALGTPLRCVKLSWDAVDDENGHVATAFAGFGSGRGAESTGALSLAFVPVCCVRDGSVIDGKWGDQGVHGDAVHAVVERLSLGDGLLAAGTVVESHCMEKRWKLNVWLLPWKKNKEQRKLKLMSRRNGRMEE